VYTCYALYSRTELGLSPEIVYFNEGHTDFTVHAGDEHNLLRPETVESLFVLYRVTHNSTYRDWAWKIFGAFERHARVGHGYSSLKDVTVGTNEGSDKYRDEMPSYFLAETLKYFYLLFSPVELISMDRWVFNTEAHPLTVRT